MALSQLFTLDTNKIGVEGAIALAGALKATSAMCFSMCARHVLVAILGAVFPSHKHSLNFGTDEVNLDVGRIVTS